ncbi:MAG: GlsB/YeaQ/YmgE family stress response membrane protein [Chloroflexota bacterium]
MAIVLIILLILGVIAFVGLVLLVGNLIGAILTLIVAGLIGLIAEAIVPGRIPFGFFGSILAGLIGSWLGVALIGPIGPFIFHVPVISAFVGAVIIAFLYSLVTRQFFRTSP